MNELCGVDLLGHKEHEAELFGAFIMVVESLMKPTDILWFANHEPRKPDSLARRLMDEGPESFADLDTPNRAISFCVAIALGG